MDLTSYNPEEYYQPSPESVVKGHLRFELGWTEVRSGLGLVLRGYILLMLCTVILVVTAVVLIGMGPRERAKIPWQVRDVGFFLGLGLFGLLCIYCYGCVLVGHWRCLMNAPERRGARWLIFGCLTCTLAGPALGVAANLTGVENKVKLERGLDGVKEIKMSKEGAIMQLGSAGVQTLGSVLFVLFLRAVANCFGDRWRVVVLDMYLALWIILTVGSFYLGFRTRDIEDLLKYAPLLGLAFVVTYIAYVTVIIIVRRGITKGLAKLAPAPSQVKGLTTALTQGSVLSVN